MKVVQIREKVTKLVQHTYMMNDDVVISEETNSKLTEAGYEAIVYHPAYIKDQATLSEEVETLLEDL